MNRKQLVVLLVVFIVLGLAGWALYQRGENSWQSANKEIGQKLLGDLPVNDVTHLAIKQGTNQVNLVKKDDLWRVAERKDYPANYSEISGFLLKVRDLKSVQTEQVGPSQLPKLGLGAQAGTNSAVVVDFLGQNDKPIRSLFLGKKHMRKSDRPSPYGDLGDEGWPDGRYIKVGNNSSSVALVSDAMANIEPKPEQWLNKDFFKVEKARSIAVDFPVATNSWKLTRETETGEWKLADAKPGEQLDPMKISGMSNPFSGLSFNDVDMSAKPEDLGLDKPTVLTVDTFDGFDYVVKVGRKTNETVALTLNVSAQIPKEREAGKDEKPEDKTRLDKEFKEKQKKLEDKLSQEKGFANWTYLVAGWSLDSMTKERSQLLAEKKPEPKKDEPKKEEPKTEDKPALGELPAAPQPPATTPEAPKPEAKPQGK
jgi:uncharacterized protein DUF4340